MTMREVQDRRIIRQMLLAAGILLWAGALSFVSAQGDEDASASEQAIAFFNQAQDLHENKKYPEAIELYDKAIKAVPEFPEAEYQRGDAYFSLGKIAEAESSLRAALQHRPEWSLALAKLGEILVTRYASLPAPEAEKIRSEAASVLERAIKSDAANFPAYAAMIDLQLASNADESSLRPILSAVERITDGKMNAPASIWARRAALEERLKMTASARRSLNAALAADAANPSVISLAAQFALNDGDVERSANYLAILKKKRGTLSGAERVLEAKALALQGRRDEARQILVGMSPASEEVTRLIAEIETGASVSAEELEAKLAKDPTNVTYLARLCEMRRTTSPEAALLFCKRAVDAEPQNVNHAIGFAGALVQAKRFSEAVTLIRKLIEYAPDNVTARVNLASALFQLKRYSEAKAEYQWLVGKVPEKPIVHFLLGVTHDSLGEHLDAMANYQTFLRLADAKINQTEIERVNLRLPALQKLIKSERARK